MSRKLFTRNRLRQSPVQSHVRPATRAHLLRPLSRNDIMSRKRQPQMPTSAEQLDLVQGTHLMICTIKDFNKSKGDVMYTKSSEDHSTKEQTQILRVHLRSNRKMSENSCRETYQHIFLRAQEEEERQFRDLCRRMGILH